MAAGIPVITTKNGVSGLNRLNNSGIILCDTIPEILNTLIRLMIDDNMRLKQSLAAREYVKKFHSYDVMRYILTDVYKRII